MQQDLTQGSIRAGLIRFSLPLIAGNLLQQLYNVADTLIVGRFLGNVALAAVGSAFSLMILLTSLILGLCMGSGVVFSQLYGEGNTEKLKTAMTNAFCLIAALSLLLMALSYALLNAFISLLRVPQEAVPDITSYLLVIFAALTGRQIPAIEDEFAGRGYGDFKKALAEVVVTEFGPVRERALEMLGAPEELDRVLSENAAKAETVANRTLNDVYERVGLLRRV